MPMVPAVPVVHLRHTKHVGHLRHPRHFRHARHVRHLAVTRSIRIAAVGDLHYGRASAGMVKPVATAVRRVNADVLVLCGDLTDYGLVDEATALAKELSTSIEIPMVGVLGNHDYESGALAEVRQILVDAGLRLLDGD